MKEQTFKKRLDVLTDHLEKGGQGSGRKNIFDNTKKGSELARSMIKSTPERTQAYLAVLKNINLIEGYVPMYDDEVMKEFGEIPEIMKNEEARPPMSWWDAGMQRASSHSDDPKGFLVKVWFGNAAEKGDENTEAGKPQHRNWKHKFGQEISNCSKSLEDEALTDAVIKALAKTVEEDEELKKAIPAAALAAIPAVAGEIGKVGDAVGSAFQESGNDTSRKSEEKDTKKKSVSQKAVATEPSKGTEAATKKRKPDTDEGGESEVKGDPTKGNVDDLKPSQTTKDM